MSLSTRCPAKLNLGLRVTGQRENGYHELDTLFCAIDLFDELWMVRRDEPGITLAVTNLVGRGLDVPASEDNLVCRALRALDPHVGEPSLVTPGFEIELMKGIPAGGGLGGGSSDAAQALRCGSVLLSLELSDERLRELALGLGADVPFLLDGGLKRAKGVGEQLEQELFDQPLWFALVLPPFGTSTADVFRHYARVRAASGASPEDAGVDEIRVDGLPFDLGNDLEPPAFATEPRLRALAEHLRKEVPDLALSGSGSTLFVARAREDQRDEAVHRLQHSLETAPDGEAIRLLTADGPVSTDPMPGHPPGG